jgi:hypothetical protein
MKFQATGFSRCINPMPEEKTDKDLPKPAERLAKKEPSADQGAVSDDGLAGHEHRGLPGRRGEERLA